MADEDLSEFRQKWLKELEQRNELNEKPCTSAASTQRRDSDSSKHSKSDRDDVASEETNSLNVWQSIQNVQAEDCLQDKGPQHHPVARNDEDQRGELVNNVFDGHSEDSAIYYPFRILTTLLNHASTEEAPKQRRKRSSGVQQQQQKTGLAATPKRAYFSSTINDKQEDGSLKKAKKDDVKMDAKEERGSQSKGYLDLFIADLNEISEIPFFDVSLPREVAVKIFWYLDIKDLCRCAQVSKSWRSLAEDELLWCNLCRTLGYEKDALTVEYSNWKSRVRQYVVIRRTLELNWKVSKSWRSLAEDELLWCNLCRTLGYEKDALTVEYSNWKSRVRQYVVIRRTLELNWKGRIGKLHNLHHAKGGVLCAAHSHRTTIVAGYSNCQTKLWDVMSGETCIFQPSSTALIIDESEEEGTISNEILHVATCHKVTAAAYSHGFVDVWSNEEGTEPMYTFTCEGQGSLRQPSSLRLWENPHSVYLSVASGHHLQVHNVHGGEGCVRETLVFDSVVKKTKWLQDTKNAASSFLTPTLSIATNNTVGVMALYNREVGCRYDMLELHNIVDAPVTCMDARLHPEQVVVGFTLNTGPAQYFRVDVYDILTRKIAASLGGHTACVLCINVEDSPQHQLVTGSRDRKVRVFDVRVAQSALMTLMGHSAAVTTVQMDEWKVVSGDEAGFVCVWDQRMTRKLWEMNNRHPVRYCHFEERQLVIGHVPYVKQQYSEFDFDTGLHQRHRGSLHVYDFLADQMTQGVPEICLSTYDEPQGYNYNIGLAVPYDTV